MQPVTFKGHSQPINRWIYQLQGSQGSDLDLQPLIAAPAELAVIDYSRNGSERSELTPTEIQSLKDSGKLVLGYMPIGAADAGRFYDQNLSDRSPFSSPAGRSIVGRQNPDFPGTFYVRYWSPAWQTTLFGNKPLPRWIQTSQNPNNYLERILAAGFDGVYLDDIDAYQQFNSDGNGSRPTAALEMLLLIRDLSVWAKAKNPRFLIMPQNGENLFNDALENLDDNGNGRLDQRDAFIGRKKGRLFLDINDNEKRDKGERSLNALDTNRNGKLSRLEIKDAYFQSIDGLGAEDFFFNGDAAQDNLFVDTLAPQNERIDDFKFTGENYLEYASRGLPILNVEYLSDRNQTGIEQYRRAISSDFQFTNPAIQQDTDAPAFTGTDLHQLPLVPFQAPSRGLDQLPVNLTLF
jgi:uncharacterized protein (TIGR01370 family)